MSTDRDHVTPLAPAADRLSNDQDAAGGRRRPSQKSRRKRCILCCTCCTALVVTIAAVLVILAVTVFKVREPKLTMNSVTIQRLSVNTGPSLGVPLAVNITAVTDISVKNPNAASFRFGYSTTSIYYRSQLAGIAYGPPGKAAAHRTFRINITVDMLFDQLVTDPRLTVDIGSGELELSSSTKVGGRVMVLGIFKHHVDVMMNCTMTVSLSNQTILNQSCGQRLWL